MSHFRGAPHQQQADALGLLAETALHSGIDPGAPGERYQVVVHVDAPALADPVQALRARHDAQGLRLHARTAIPGWLGERLNVGWAIDVMHPLAG